MPSFYEVMIEHFKNMREILSIKFSKIALIIFSVLLMCLVANAQTNENSNKNKKLVKDKPLKIKSRYQPNAELVPICFFSTNANRLFVALLVTFDKSGKITDAEIAQGSGCKDFDEECLRVAKKIKFKPEIRNGEPITVIKPVEYVIVINRS